MTVQIVMTIQKTVQTTEWQYKRQNDSTNDRMTVQTIVIQKTVQTTEWQNKRQNDCTNDRMTVHTTVLAFRDFMTVKLYPS